MHLIRLGDITAHEHEHDALRACHPKWPVLESGSRCHCSHAARWAAPPGISPTAIGASRVLHAVWHHGCSTACVLRVTPLKPPVGSLGETRSTGWQCRQGRTRARAAAVCPPFATFPRDTELCGMVQLCRDTTP